MEDYKVKYLDQITTFNPVKKELKGLPGLGKFLYWRSKRQQPRRPFDILFKRFIANDAVSKEVKKEELFGYPSIVSLVTIFTGILILIANGYDVYASSQTPFVSDYWFNIWVCFGLLAISSLPKSR